MEIKLDLMPFECSTWLVGDVKTFRPPSDAMVVKDQLDRPIVLFRTPWSKNFAQERNPHHTFLEMG